MMSNEIIIGLFTLGGTVVGGVITGLFYVLAAKIDHNKEDMKKDIKRLVGQVKSYWYLEDEYVTKINDLQTANKLPVTPRDSLKISTRTIVASNGQEYPKMTAQKADDILRKYE